MKTGTKNASLTKEVINAQSMKEVTTIFEGMPQINENALEIAVSSLSAKTATTYVQDIKAQINEVASEYDIKINALKIGDVEQKKELEKQKLKEVGKELSNGFHGLFNITDYCKKVNAGVKPAQAFELLIKMPISEVLKAGGNGRKYTFKTVQKAYLLNQADKVNALANDVKGQRLNHFVNELHKLNKSLLVGELFTEAKAVILRAMVAEKFINLEKVNTFTAVQLFECNVSLTDKVRDLYHAWKITKDENARKASIKKALFEAYEVDNKIVEVEA